MTNNFETLINFISTLAALVTCALIWIWASGVEEQRIIETCDNYGSFVYQDVRYTCEKVEELK
jgi:hypothetical protein